MLHNVAMQEDWDIERLRAETAGCEQTTFFNNAGASLQPRALVARVIEYLPRRNRQGATRPPTVCVWSWCATDSRQIVLS